MRWAVSKPKRIDFALYTNINTMTHQSQISPKGTEVVETHHIIEPYVYYRVFGVLMILFIMTVGVAFFDLSKHLHWPAANIVVAMIIAVVKAGVIVLYFMHVKYSSRLTQMFAMGALVWLAILFIFSFADYFTRSWIPQPGGWTTTIRH
jgi:cytochrome c oxidase subunit 4